MIRRGLGKGETSGGAVVRRSIRIVPLVRVGERPGIIGRDSFRVAYKDSKWAKWFALSYDDLEYLLNIEAENTTDQQSPPAVAQRGGDGSTDGPHAGNGAVQPPEDGEVRGMGV